MYKRLKTFCRQEARGMSLISLLISMAIILIMLWMFLSSMGSEFGSSGNYDNLLNVIL